MPEQTDRAPAAIARLLQLSHLLPPEELPGAVHECARVLGAEGSRILLVTRDQAGLVPLVSPDQPPSEPLSLEGTLAGRAYRSSEVVPGTTGSPRLHVPLLDGTERLGVLELEAVDEAQLEPLREPALRFAAAVGQMVVSKGQYTDWFERTRRALPMGVPAELLWRQLPPLTFATERFVVAAQLEPWHEVGGDAFDYSLDGDVLHLAVFDGMGHGLAATLLASVALAAYRNARRSGQGLVETARVVDEVLSAQFGTESFVTGVLARLDLRAGRIELLCAAHPAPLLVRDGRPVGEVSVSPGLPLGFGGRDDEVVTTSLQPGDRLVLFSDGVVEARSDEGDFFGLERLVDLLAREESGGYPPPETLRRLITAVLQHQSGRLQDDATVLLLEWAGDATALLPD